MKIVTLLILMVISTTLTAQTDPEVENFNYVLGTQTIGPKYKFTSDDALVETAKRDLQHGFADSQNIVKPEFVRFIGQLFRHNFHCQGSAFVQIRGGYAFPRLFFLGPQQC